MTNQEHRSSETTIAFSSSKSFQQTSDFEIAQHEAATEKDLAPPKQDTEAQPVTNLENVIPAVDVPPNGGYGWVCVVCVALINGHTWGINS